MCYIASKNEEDNNYSSHYKNMQQKCNRFLSQSHRWNLFGFPSGSTASGLWQILTSRILLFEVPQLVPALGVHKCELSLPVLLPQL